MIDIALKYRLLDRNSRKEVEDFLDFLLSKRNLEKSESNSEYKKRILTVSTWSDKDLLAFEENRLLFNDWKIEKW